MYVWKNKTERVFADGLGRNGDSEIILVESSNFKTKRERESNHTILDNLGLIRLRTDSLHIISAIKSKRFGIAKCLSIYGAQCQNKNDFGTEIKAYRSPLYCRLIEAFEVTLGPNSGNIQCSCPYTFAECKKKHILNTNVHVVQDSVCQSPTAVKKKTQRLTSELALGMTVGLEYYWWSHGNKSSFVMHKFKGKITS
ncbi:hypothetical protein CLU79DRAFT_173145 [Phycomyces nitens]|nr:hypothetical protein CLU79DRAFT_173145 [Phycomyces nitens]